MAEIADFLVFEKNKTETIAAGKAPLCRFFGSDGSCPAPALPGSAYCAKHRRICTVDPQSGDGARAIRALEREAQTPSAVPPEFFHLIGQFVPELDSDDEPRDIAACIDIVPRDDRDDDGADR